MWRLIIVAFGFLGWSFYTLSGGSEYAPAQGSRQAVAAQAAIYQTRVAQVTPTRPPMHQNTTPTSQQTDAAQIILASTATAPTAHAAPRDGANKRAALVRTTTHTPTQIPTTTSADITKISALTAIDMRAIKGSRVNMRKGPGKSFPVVAKLTRGTKVRVLRDNGDGWLKLRVGGSDNDNTGRIGWMADFLLTAAN